MKKNIRQGEPPHVRRSTIKRFWYLAVSNVFLKNFAQKDRLAMIASLAVILPDFWLKHYEKILATDMPQKIDMLENMNGKSPNSRAISRTNLGLLEMIS